MKRAYLLLNLALCLFTASANGNVITWASGASGNWSNPTNWSPNQVPGPEDTAAITASGNYTVTVDTSVTVNGLILGSSDATTQTVLLNGQSLAISQSATVNTNGVINVGNGTLDFDPYGGSIMNGSLNCSGGTLGGVLTIASNGAVNLAGISGSTQAVIFASFTLTNYGTVVWSNIDLQGSSAHTIDNFGLWDAQSDNAFNGNTSTFNNYGTVRKDGGSAITTFDSGTTFNNYGTVDVESAQINIDLGNGGGLFNTASNAIIWLGVSDSFNLSAGATFTGPGLVAGNLYGDNPAGVIYGSLNFYSGSLGGYLTVASNAVVNLANLSGDTQAVVFASLTLTNHGTIVWSNMDLEGSSAQVDNFGLWDAQSDNTFYGSGSTFNNYGTVRKDGGNAITTFDSATTFNNYGTVDVETAQINIDMGSGGGLFNTDTNAIVWLGVPNGFGLSDNVTFTGPGLVGGNLVGSGIYGGDPAGTIHGSLNFYYGSLGGDLTIASDAVANLIGFGGPTQTLVLNYLILTNCGTVIWSNIDLECTSVQVYNHGLWDALSDNTFYGNGIGSSNAFNNCGTVRKDGGSAVTTFDSSTTFNNLGKTAVQKGQVTLAGSCSLTNGTLNFGICGPNQFGSINFPNNVQLSGRLSVNLRNHYSPAVSNSFPVVVYGAETGTFSSLSLPRLSGLGWQTNVTSTTFTLSVVTASPLQLSAGLSVSKNSMSLSWDGLLGQTYQVQCATNLAPPNWVDLGGPIAGTNGPITVLDSLSASPNKYYRIQSQ
jgi:hypothetical protein